MHLKDAAMSADGRQPHILVLNDTQETLDLMQELLEEEGYMKAMEVPDEGDCGDGSGRGNGWDDAGGAARA
jgi:hypothetical protein